jgi:hypothetical protein
MVRLNSSGLLIRVCCGSTTPPAKPRRLTVKPGQPPCSGSGSDGQVLAALAAARGQDGATGPGTHPLAKTVDLSPPTVVRLERTLAHWNSRSLGKLSLVRGSHVVRRALEDMAQPVNGTGDPRTGQTEPLPAVKHRDFHNASTAGDLGCGKSRSAGRLREAGCRHGMGKPHCSLRTHLVDEPVDNELRLVTDVVEPSARLRGEGSHR